MPANQSMPQQFEPIDLATARITLIAARAAAGVDEGLVAYTLLPNSAPIDSAAAAQSLVRLSKPVACFAQAASGGVVLDCRPIEGATDLKRHHRDVALMKTAFLDSVRTRFAPNVEDPIVWIYYGTGSGLYPISTVGAWVEDYDVQDVGMVIEPPQETWEQQGAVAALRLFRDPGGWVETPP